LTKAIVFSNILKIKKLLTFKSMKGEAMTKIDCSVKKEWLEALFSQNEEGLRKLVEAVVQALLQAEMAEHLGAEPYERSMERRGWRNGYKARKLNSRVGRLELKLPQARDGSFSPQLFNRYQRSERALLSSLIEMYVQGVSTRKVRKIVEKLCGNSFSSSTVSALVKQLDEEISSFRERRLEGSYPYITVDARYEKVRLNSRVVNLGVLIAKGVNQDGYRELLNLELVLSETEDYWKAFFEKLKDRGLTGVKLVSSDAHQGLRNAIDSCFTGASWQYCQTHFSRTMLEKVGKKDRKRFHSDLKRLYEAEDMREARILVQWMAEYWGKSYPKLMEKLEEDLEYVLACLNFPEKHRKKIRTTNSLERLNREIKRRTRVVSIFPNQESCLRLIGALMLEQHEEWLAGYKYLDMSELQKAEKPSNSTNCLEEEVCRR
jgi:putative transposase